MNSMQNGIPDCYFSGDKGDLWAEMKYISTVPKRDTTLIYPNLSELQKKWLNNRYDEGRNTCVILGSPIGCYVFTDKTWTNGITRNHLVTPRLEVIEWILHQTKLNYKTCAE